MSDGHSFYRGKTVLVTGGSGFVGRHLVEQLLASSAHVIVPIHKRPLEGRLFGATSIVADLTVEEDCLRATRDVDYVFHAAGAVAGAGGSADDAMSAVTANLVLTARVLDAARKNGVDRCLIFSSSTVYPDSDHPVREEEAWDAPPADAYFGYGWMRRYLEKLGELVSRQSPTRVAIVRPTAIYGRFDNFDPAASHFVPALVRRAVERVRPFEVWGTGAETRDLLHVADLARACLLALQHYACAKPINIGYGDAVSVREVVRVILDAADYRDADVVFDAKRPATIRSRSVDCTRATDAFGFMPWISIEQGLHDTVRWYAHTSSAAKAGC